MRDKKSVLPTTSFIDHPAAIGEMLYDAQAAQTSFVVQDISTRKTCQSYKASGVVYKPYAPQNDLLRYRVIRFPEQAAEYASTETLVNEVRAFIRAYMELPKVYEDIAVYYVFLTWVYDRFNELPYLRIRGDYGSGKTRFLSVLSSIAYKPIMASGASTVAPLFHMLHQIGGTLILDEADFRFSKETSDITKILNNGNAKGFPVLRCEKKDSKQFIPKAYNVFGPKIIASRNTYDDHALESRCITFDTNFTRTRDVPLTLPDDFEQQAVVMRNKMLSWRFDHCFTKQKLYAKKHLGLSQRLSQIYGPLCSLITDQNIVDDIINFARTREAQAKSDRGQQVEAQVLSVIKKRSEANSLLSVGGIATDVEEVYGRYYERRVTPNWIGNVIRRKLRLSTQKSNGTYIISREQQPMLKRLYEQYDLL